MAAMSLPKPGTPLGPCKGQCPHTDCHMTRTMAESTCTVCCKPIGYGRDFYRDDRVRGEKPLYAHAKCFEGLTSRKG
jgi:hypothetical protein